MNDSHSEEIAAHSVWRPRSHIAQLDGIRGLAILLVTLYRFGKDAPVEGSWARGLASFVNSGEHGVELFFVLSGFLITGILLESRSSSAYFLNFFARRSLRIFPLYFASLLLCLLVLPAVAGILQWEHPFHLAQENQLYLWTYSTNIAMSLRDAWCFGSLDHFWSLAVEEHFYLVWPVAVLALSPRRLLGLALGGALTATVLRCAWIAAGLNETAPMVLTLFRCDGLLLGAALAIWMRQPGNASSRLMNVARWLWVPCLALALLVDYQQRRILMLGESLWAVTWVLMLYGVMTSAATHWLARVFDDRRLKSLGKYSYGMYVFQNPLIALMAPVWLWLGLQHGAGGSLVGHVAYVLLMSGLTITLAWLSWHGFEKHWLKLKRRFGDEASQASNLCVPMTLTHAQAVGPR